MKNKKVICNKAGRLKHCNRCVHSKPHEKGEIALCTIWGECEDGDGKLIKVRCVYI